MKYKYHKGSEADFEGHPGAILVVKSASTGRVYHLGLDYAGRDKDIEKVGDIIIAHRELEPDPWMLFESPTGRLITEPLWQIQRRCRNHAVTERHHARR